MGAKNTDRQPAPMVSVATAVPTTARSGSSFKCAQVVIDDQCQTIGDSRHDDRLLDEQIGRFSIVRHGTNDPRLAHHLQLSDHHGVVADLRY